MTDTERERAFNIAAQARRYALLAERPELLYPEAGVRAERVLADDTRSALDRLLLAGASELDRLCAAAVAKLGSDAPQARPILDLLGVLPADNLLAVYAALPEKKRRQCEADHVWSYHIHNMPEGIEDAMQELAELAAQDEAEIPEFVLEQAEAMKFRRLSEALERRALGLPYDLSEDEEALAEAGEGALAELAD